MLIIVDESDGNLKQECGVREFLEYAMGVKDWNNLNKICLNNSGEIITAK